MGYTHYWSHDPKLDGKTLFAAFQDARKIVEVAKKKGIHLCDRNGEGEPVIAESIWLNGCEKYGEACETFYFPAPSRDIQESLSRGRSPGGYCKTQRLPYDMVVCAILLVLKHHLKDQLRIASDGCRWKDEWLLAERMVKEVQGYEVTYVKEG